METPHQFIEMKEGKTPGNMMYKDVMCADCGMMKRMHEDGKMETMKEGKEEMPMEESIGIKQKDSTLKRVVTLPATK